MVEARGAAWGECVKSVFLQLDPKLHNLPHWTHGPYDRVLFREPAEAPISMTCRSLRNRRHPRARQPDEAVDEEARLSVTFQAVHSF